MRGTSSLMGRLAPGIAVAFTALAPPVARADAFVCAGDCPEREWPGVPAQIRWSLESALLAVEGRLRVARTRARAGESGEERSFGAASFAVDRTLKGAVPGATLEVELPAYPPTEPSWWQSLTDRSPVEELAERLRDLERELVDGGLEEPTYQARRAELRSRIVRSPAYRDADRYLLVRVRISRGLDDPPYRDADVLLEEGGSYVLMAFARAPRGRDRLVLRERELDIRPSRPLLEIAPRGAAAAAGGAGAARAGPRLLEPLDDVRLGMEQRELLDLRGEGLEPAIGDDDEDAHDQLLFETVVHDGLEARVLYVFDPHAPVLEAVQIREEHPGSRIEEALQRRVVEASSRWGAPTSFAIEKLDGSELVAVIWTVEGRFELAIDYPPGPSRDEEPAPLVTRYTSPDWSERLAEQRLEGSDTISLDEERRRILGLIERAPRRAFRDAGDDTE